MENQSAENKEVNQIEQAKKILADEDNRIIDEAAKEFNEFVGEWSKKHNCRLTVFGSFLDDQMTGGIKVIKNK